MKEQKTIKEHYVPQFYLKNFTDADGMLHIYDYQTQKRFARRPQNICCKNNLYETRWNGCPVIDEYLLHNDIEKIFSQYEGKFAVLLRKIISVCHLPENENKLVLYGKEKEDFIRFITNIIIRNPESMNRLGVDKVEKDDFEHDSTVQIKELLEALGISGADSLFLAAKKKAMLTEESENNFPKVCSEILKGLNYAFFYAKSGEFVTSDMPVYVGDDPMIIGEDKTCVYFPISPKILVIFGNYHDSREFRNKVIVIDEGKVDDFNIKFSRYDSAKKFLLGSSGKLIERYIPKREFNY